jgi:hypothetical protein
MLNGVYGAQWVREKRKKRVVGDRYDQSTLYICMKMS